MNCTKGDEKHKQWSEKAVEVPANFSDGKGIKRRAFLH
jgi:hypothetical protein